jgi:diphthamide synthase (EF-2-diphthine--ammonia ligase)
MSGTSLFFWSGGKDSALALHEILRGGEYEVGALVTTVTWDYDRISMHGLRRSLIEWQSDSLGFPLEEVILSPSASNEEYETRLDEMLLAYKERGVRTVIFGDIFLGEIR